jgi:hypothetical protein
MVGRFTTLAEFVQSRLESGFYEDQLGPMHQVEKDMAELSEGLAFDAGMLSPQGDCLKSAYLKGFGDRVTQGKVMVFRSPQG